MPGKHVHFGSVTEYVDDDYSEGPSSPPPLGQGSPYDYSPLPNISVTPHPALAAVVGNHFAYDVTSPPVRGVTITHPSYHVPALWNQPITHPPVPSLEIECSLLPWKVTIYPSKHSVHPFITFGDFFNGLYHNLRKQVTPAEYERSAQHKFHIDNAYKRRYKRLQDYDQYEQERQGGVRRVDFLGECIDFGGLSYNPLGRVQWTLRVAVPKPSHLS